MGSIFLQSQLRLSQSRAIGSCFSCQSRLPVHRVWASRRWLQTSKPSSPSFAFAFDIDGVLVRSSDPLPQAHKALTRLQRLGVPFILLTNGGGKHETERIEELSQRLQVPLDSSLIVQSHTPFADLNEYKDKSVLVVGGDGNKCRDVAERYGFESVITPADIYVADPSVWPFSTALLSHYAPLARPLPSNLQIAAIFVYNDPRDWGLDSAIITDLLLSHAGIPGTLSPKNNTPSLPNRGFQQDNQPPLFYSNPDLWWAAKHPLPRLGQGGFREAMEGIWAAVTGGPNAGITLQKHVWGKPHQATYEFAERQLLRNLKTTSPTTTGLKTVYMVGDNPASDIAGANSFRSPSGAVWKSVLVETGVFVSGSEPAYVPNVVVGNVGRAVDWALSQEGMGQR